MKYNASISYVSVDNTEWYNKTMGLFMNQEDDRSELQQRISAGLQEKARVRAELENKPLPDGIKDSQYIKDFTGTSRYLWFWIALALIIVVGVVIFMVSGH